MLSKKKKLNPLDIMELVLFQVYTDTEGNKILTGVTSEEEILQLYKDFWHLPVNQRKPNVILL